MKLSTLDLPDHDEVSVVPQTEEAPEGVEVEEMWKGVTTWVNPINGFRVVRLHYSADPKKRQEEWKANERRLYGVGGAEWNREYELVWEAIAGKGVYSDYWNHEFHVAKQSLGWNPKLPVCRGWDFGLNAACLFVQLFPHMRLFVLREAVSDDIAFERFLEEIPRLSNEWFPGATFIDFIDPTGRYRQGADARTYAMMLANPPLRANKIISGANDLAARIKGVTDFLKETVKGLPCYVVDPSCETLIKGFNGEYHYPLDAKGRLKDKPEKNFVSHIHDADQYVCSKIRNVKLAVSQAVKKVNEPRFFGSGPDEIDRLVAME